MATCDAGHGCSITCSNGCYAVYNHSAGKCSKGCDGALMLNEKDTYSIEISDIGADKAAEFFGGFAAGISEGAFAKPMSLKMENATGAEIMDAIRGQVGG